MNVTIDCPCPPKADGTARHESDTVMLREKLDFRQATSIRNAVAMLKMEDPDSGFADILAVLTEAYILQGVEAWTLVDEKGKAVSVTKPELRSRLLSDPVLAEPIGDAADELYKSVVLLPLLTRALVSSLPTPTVESTSARKPGQRRRPRPSKPSSITTIPMDGTATTTTSRAGDSSSSPNSATAA